MCVSFIHLYEKNAPRARTTTQRRIDFFLAQERDRETEREKRRLNYKVCREANFRIKRLNFQIVTLSTGCLVVGVFVPDVTGRRVL